MAFVEVSSWCRWHIPTRRPSRAGARLLSAAGALASELMVSGLFSKGDCSIYQLFRFSVWVTSYKGVVYVIRLLSVIYRGETIIHIQKNRKYLFNSIQNNQKPTIICNKTNKYINNTAKYLYIRNKYITFAPKYK